MNETTLAAPEKIKASSEEALTKNEVARRFGKTVRTIEFWMESEGLPHYRIGRSVFFKWSVVQAWIDSKMENKPRFSV